MPWTYPSIGADATLFDVVIAIFVVTIYATVMAFLMMFANAVLAREWKVSFYDAWTGMFLVAMIAAALNWVSDVVIHMTDATVPTKVSFVAVIFCVQVWVMEQRMAFKRGQAIAISLLTFYLLAKFALFAEESLAPL